ncbi:MAG: outer membrane lipoprotein carrier protein LolA, partial [Proteobacteria bacterium]|nr:outer membrane lipoprotein carrier protein LolA [Pseudomonadota bacterium]
FFKHPYFLRLEQEKPKAETIIANNDILWWYIPDKKCAYQYPSKDFGKELRLLSDIFRGLSRVENSFQVVLQGRNTSGEHEMDLIPDPPWEEIDRIALTITGQYEIRSVQIYNRLGSITIFNLGGLTEKKDFEEGFFRFVAPKGVRLMIEGAVQ